MGTYWGYEYIGDNGKENETPIVYIRLLPIPRFAFTLWVSMLTSLTFGTAT